jgi:ADP-heptose:LPS heptosyltransferase
MLRSLASNYPQIEVREIPKGFSALPFFSQIVLRPGWTLLTLGLVSIGYSLPLRFFFLLMSLIPGNRTVGFHDKLLDVSLNFDISLLMIENLRRLLPHALPEVAIGSQPSPQFNVPMKKPEGFPYSTGTYVVAHLFGASIAHALPPSRWRALFEHIASSHPELTVILTGTPEQKKIAEQIAVGIPTVIVRTDLSIPELSWIIDQASLYIGIDTGVTHLAGMLGQKSLVVSHCMDPAWMPSYNPHARIIYNSAHCTPDNPASCIMVKEGAHTYRRCTYDISDNFLFSSVDLALSTKEREVPLFAGRVDEGRR